MILLFKENDKNLRFISVCFLKLTIILHCKIYCKFWTCWPITHSRFINLSFNELKIFINGLGDRSQEARYLLFLPSSYSLSIESIYSVLLKIFNYKLWKPNTIRGITILNLRSKYTVLWTPLKFKKFLCPVLENFYPFNPQILILCHLQTMFWIPLFSMFYFFSF